MKNFLFYVVIIKGILIMYWLCVIKLWFCLRLDYDNLCVYLVWYFWKWRGIIVIKLFLIVELIKKNKDYDICLFGIKGYRKYIIM